MNTKWALCLFSVGCFMLYRWGMASMAEQKPRERRYSITDLGTLGGKSSDAAGINNASQISGYADAVNGRRHAFLYHSGSMHDVDASKGTGSVARGINVSGAVAGYVMLGNSLAPTQAFVYRNGKMHLFAGLPGGHSCEASGINDGGLVTGTSDGANGIVHAVIWTEDRIKDLGTLPGGSSSNATGINVNGQVVGAADMGKSHSHAFLYSDNKMRDLGTLGGDNSYGWAINSHGNIVGYAQTKSGKWHAFLWKQGQMRDLGVIDTGESEALGINAEGQVVGRSGVLFNHPEGKNKAQAFLWENGAMNDLNRLIPASSGWRLEYASAINEQGQIVGTGTLNGQHHAFLLSPASP